MGRYPSGSPPLGLTSYDEFLGPHEPQTSETCQEKCYGFLGSKVTTDVKRALSGKVATYAYSTPHPATSGRVIFSACQTSSASTCGLWQADIAEQSDGQGGVRGTISPTSVKQLLVETDFRYDQQEQLRAGIHPKTGDLVVFATGTSRGQKVLDVLACASPGQGASCASLKRIARFPWTTPYSGHYRVVATDALLYLHFLVRSVPLEPPGSDASDDPPPNPPEVVGSYAIAVSEAHLRSGAPVAAPSRLGDTKASGDELVYMPRAGRAALFTKKTIGGQDALVRCFLP